MGEINTQTFGRQLNELLILATLVDGAKHGYQIALEAEQRSGGSFELQHGTLYPILHRLEKQRLIRGRWTRVGGRRRKVYELTRAGASRLRADASELKRTFAALMRMLTEVPLDSNRARTAST
jgi:DNA-binding PadR family transcriptional regulator